MKATEEVINKWKDTPCLQVARINTVKMFIVSKVLQRVKLISIQIPRLFCREIQNQPADSQKHPLAKAILNKTTKLWACSNFRLQNNRY